jgi:hypothetical protein
VGRRYGRSVSIDPRRARQLPDARHLLAQRSSAIDSVGIEFDSYRLGVEVTELDPYLKYVLLVLGFNMYFAEA